MQSVINEFINRRNEIKVYIDFLHILEVENEIVEKINTSLDIRQLRKIFYSNAFLLMYNLVESSIRNSIQHIYDHFKQNDIEYDNLKSTIQIIILSNLKNFNPSQFQSRMVSIAKDIVYHSFNPDKLISGNIDAKKVRQFAKIYGFSDATDYNACKNGEKLVEIKNKRNDLAHGIISFSECGREIVLSDIDLSFQECSAYLECIMNNVQSYLNNQDFLR